jgi:HopA1 effector protein family
MTSPNGEAVRAIKEVLSSIRLVSPVEFEFAGRSFAVRGSGGGHQHNGHNHQHEHVHAHAHEHRHGSHTQAAPDAQGQAFISTLSVYLYEYAYSRPFVVPVPEHVAPDLTADAGLLEALSMANTTRDRWEHGWSIAQVMQQGQVAAQKGELRRNLWPGQFLSKDGPAALPRQGAEISVFYARESRSLQTGFYYAFGDEPEEAGDPMGLVRLYWNISFEGAPRLVGLVTSRLNRFHVPFRMKFATARSQFARTDVSVVYIAKRFFRITAELMLDVHPEIADALGEDVPLFSKKLAPGLGVAEDPGTGESFGQSRCRRLAESVWNCYLRGEQGTQARWEEFARLLKGGGLDPEHTHLNSGSLDWYELPPEVA